MAIDTAAKRKSAINVGLLFLRLGVIPDGGDIEAAQRLHVQGLYSGIAAGMPIAVSKDRDAWKFIQHGFWGKVVPESKRGSFRGNAPKAIKYIDIFKAVKR